MLAFAAKNERLNDAVGLNGGGEFFDPMVIEDRPGLQGIRPDLVNRDRCAGWACRGWLGRRGSRSICFARKESGESLTQDFALLVGWLVHGPGSPSLVGCSFQRRA